MRCGASTEEQTLFNRDSTRVPSRGGVSRLEDSRRLHHRVECLVSGCPVSYQRVFD